jgi:hypothetical protein
MALTSEILVRLKATQTGSNDFGGSFGPTMEALLQTSNGTGAGQADILFIDERTVASATNDDLDLAGVLTSAFGATITAAELVAVFVINARRGGGTPNTTNLTIGAGSNPVVGFLPSGDTIGPIRPGGFVMIGCADAAGIGAVTASTGDILRIANSSGAAAVYQIAILARSA